MQDRARPAVPPSAVPSEPEQAPDPFAALADTGVVPIEPNGHLLNLYRHRDRQRAQADLDRIRREATDAGDAA